VTREPIALMISLYDYTGTFTVSQRTLPQFEEIVERYREREANMTAQGVPEHLFLDHLLRHGQEHMVDFKGYYRPCDCQLHDEQNATVIAMHNLLRIDVVVVLEDMAALVPQLEYHFPWLQPFTLQHSRNKAGRPPQKLTEETLASLRQTERYLTQRRVYEFAKVVARARTVFVDQCRNGGSCPPAIVPIELDSADLATLQTTRDELRRQNCLVPPADGQSWPRFVSSVS